jgi:TniQ
VRASQLPFVPRAQPDELLSSWLERIGLLYGASIEHVLAAVLAGSDRMPAMAGQDVDADPWMRERIVRWSGVDESHVPTSISLDDGFLPPCARLTFCGRCWDDDVAQGRPPYIRQRWGQWAVVRCDVHQTWLSSRRPSLSPNIPNTGWSAVWQTTASWAARFELNEQPEYRTRIIGICGEEISRHLIFTAQVAADLERFEQCSRAHLGKNRQRRLHREILDTTSAESYAVKRSQIARRMLPEVQRFSTLDRVPSFQPTKLLWLGDRLACLLAAVELLRMREGRSAYCPAIAGIIQTPDAGKLNAPKLTRRLRISNGEIFPLASH